MQRALVIVGLLTLGTPVAQGSPPILLDHVEQPRQWTVQASAGLQALQTTQEAAAQAALQAVLEYPEGLFERPILLPWLRTDADLQLSSRSDVRGASLSLSGESQVLRLCAEELCIVPWDLSFALAYHVVPKLSERRGKWRRAYSQAGTGWRLAGGSYKGITILDMAINASHLWQGSGDESLRQESFDSDITLVSWRRSRPSGPDLNFDFIHASTKAIDRAMASNAAVTELSFVRVSGLDLGGVYLQGSAGLGGAGSFSYSVEVNDQQTAGTEIMTDDLPLHVEPIGSLTLSMGDDSQRGSLTLERRTHLTVDVELVVESRVSAQAIWRRDKDLLSADAFLATTELWTDRVTSEETLTGGAALSWERKLSRDLRLDTSIEAARSYYGQLNGDLRPSATVAIQGGARLTKLFGN